MVMVKFATTQTGIRWNKHSKNFEPIPGLLTYEEERRKVILQTRQEETHNFNGQPLSLTHYAENTIFFRYHDNDTKATGICGDIWTMLSTCLNFTLVLKKNMIRSLGPTYKNGTYGGLLEDARLHKTDILPIMVAFYERHGAVDFSPDIWVTRQRIYAHGDWKPNRTWMLDLLSMEAWAFVFAFIATLSLASFFTQRILIRYQGRRTARESFFDHFFYSFATMCNQPSNETGSGFKLLNLTIGFFAFLTIASYNSIMIHKLAEESFDAPFHDLETLLDKTNYRLVVLNHSIAHVTINNEISTPIFDRIKRSQRLTVVQNINDLNEKICKYSNKYVLLDTEDNVAMRGAKSCTVIPVGIPYHVTPIVSGISRGVKYRKSLMIGFMKLREYGLLNVIKKKYIEPTHQEKVIRQADSFAIDMDRVLVIVGILCVGIVLSIIICIAENVIFSVKKRKTIQRLAKKLSAIRRPMFVNSILRSCRPKKGCI